MSKFLITTFFSLIVLLGQIWSSWPDEYVHLVFCDVGQGDATLVTMGFTQVLIDGGRSDEVLSCLEEHIPFWDRTIELVVATHADADHIGGLDSVIEEYDVLQIMSTQFIKDSQVFLDFKQAVEAEVSMGAIFKKPILGQQMRFTQEQYQYNPIKEHQLPEVTLSVISPQVEQLQLAVENSSKTETNISDSTIIFDSETIDNLNSNDLSVVLFLQLGQVRVLMMGDLEHEGELALINANLLQDTDVLKVGHHGAKTSTSTDFLELIRPETSVVSVGKSNGYGHPSLEVMNDLMQFDSEVLRTDEMGDVHLISNGEKYWLAGDK
ncbi:MAG: MBL fold metallo-hydrolase [Candidatus Pacebacteria bacterium]|nr:MBL fold metallo-hydrolase [Candidatus Paceibacterota bacterium]